MLLSATYPFCAQIRNLCPYQNIKAGEYPSVFVSCGFNDSRVPVWGPAKWVAKMKDNQVGRISTRSQS